MQGPCAVCEKGNDMKYHFIDKLKGKNVYFCNQEHGQTWALPYLLIELQEENLSISDILSFLSSPINKTTSFNRCAICDKPELLPYYYRDIRRSIDVSFCSRKCGLRWSIPYLWREIQENPSLLNNVLKQFLDQFSLKRHNVEL